MCKTKIGLLSVFLVIVFSATESLSQDCNYWHKIVGVKNVNYPVNKVDKSDSDQIIKGIECLLELEGVKSPGSISGATHNQVSTELPQASVEVTALHYVSYLFYQRFDYASGVALLEDDHPETLNSKQVIKKAYKSYRKWFKKVKEIGLEEARKQKLDPLADSGVTWY